MSTNLKAFIGIATLATASSYSYHRTSTSSNFEAVCTISAAVVGAIAVIRLMKQHDSSSRGGRDKCCGDDASDTISVEGRLVRLRSFFGVANNCVTCARAFCNIQCPLQKITPYATSLLLLSNSKLSVMVTLPTWAIASCSWPHAPVASTRSCACPCLPGARQT